MSLLLNLRHLEVHGIKLKGELQVGELDIDSRDEMVRCTQPLHYDLEVQELDHSLLLTGSLHMVLGCRCVRCLKSFEYDLDLPKWTCHVPLRGEERAPVVNDCVDLTPYLREDILLGFPQHPLCKPGCRGIRLSSRKADKKPGDDWTGSKPSDWAELDKLNL